MAMKHTKILLIAASSLTLVACTAENSMRFNQEAGAFIDEGGFGNPTMHNLIAQSCSGYGRGGKGPKGGGVSDPVVVLDPSSTIQRPIYRVHCDGHLNGKYAQVIFRDYVAIGALQQPGGGELTESGSE